MTQDHKGRREETWVVLGAQAMAGAQRRNPRLKLGGEPGLNRDSRFTCILRMKEL